MALPAGRLHIPRGQNWLLPGQSAAVGFLDRGRSALPAVAHHAAKLVGGVRDSRMLTERLRADIGEAGFFQSDVASSAAIDDSELRKPDLLDPVVEVALQCDGISPGPNQRQVVFLVVAPFTEVILGRRNGQRDE